MIMNIYKCVQSVFVCPLGLVAEQFLESTATQLSYHGLCELNTTAKEGEISVFFRNNHFSTMIKHKVRTNARCTIMIKVQLFFSMDDFNSYPLSGSLIPACDRPGLPAGGGFGLGVSS